jgi:hypothetical protein
MVSMGRIVLYAGSVTGGRFQFWRRSPPVNWPGRVRLCIGTTDLSPPPQDEEHVKESRWFPGRPSLTAEKTGYEVTVPPLRGLDVHKKSISICVRIRVDPSVDESVHCQSEDRLPVHGRFRAFVTQPTRALQDHANRAQRRDRSSC